MSDIPRLPTTFLKSDTAKSQRQREKEARKKGKAAEHAFGKALCAQLGQPETGYRVNNQAVEGGGQNNSDLWFKSLPGWATEVKNRTHLAISFWWKKLTKENSGPCVLGFYMDGEKMMLLKVDDLRRLIQDGAEALGYDLVPRS